MNLLFAVALYEFITKITVKETSSISSVPMLTMMLMMVVMMMALVMSVVVFYYNMVIVNNQIAVMMVMNYNMMFLAGKYTRADETQNQEYNYALFHCF